MKRNQKYTGTFCYAAPTSEIFITKFVCYYSWKSDVNNIKLYLEYLAVQ